MDIRSDICWPVAHIHIDTEDVYQNRLFAVGAAIYAIYWYDGRPIAHEILNDLEDQPSASALLERGKAFLGAAQASSPRQKLDETISLIVPTRDRPADLRQCLASLQQQRRVPEEVIVVDNGPQSPGTREVVAEFPSVTYVAEPEPGLSRARNAGIRAAHGSIIAFCDDDVVLHPGWCENLVAPFADPAVQATTGLVLPHELDTHAQRLFEFYWSFDRGYVGQGFARNARDTPDPAAAPWKIGAGASMAFRAAVFGQLGMFDLRLGAGASGCSEDSEMWYRVLMSGGTCRYSPEAISFHRHRRTIDALDRQIRAYLQGHLVALFVQNERYPYAGNFRQAFMELPYHFGRRLARVLLGRHQDSDATLRAEIEGYVSGFGYYLIHRRTPAW